MVSQQDLHTLSQKLSAAAQVLSDPKAEDFQTCAQRWSDLDAKTPGAIVLPRTEQDCLETVRWASARHVPFVCKSGGMSLYSRIDSDGIVIDLSEFSAVRHDKTKRQAELIGSIRTKEVAMELAQDGFCTSTVEPLSHTIISADEAYITALPSANPVGAIPFFLNGGNSPLISKLGYASDNIISARLVTADGELVTASDGENADLFWALRGAGQYFGLVLSLTVKTYPVQEILERQDGSFWSGRFMFPLDRAEEVATAMEGIVNDSRCCTGGQIMVAALPPTRQPAVVIIPKLIGSDCDTLRPKVFKPLYDLNPLMAAGGLIQIENNGDAQAPLATSGGCKKLRLTGIPRYDSHLFPEVVKVWQKLVSTVPEAGSSVFSILWESQATARPPQATANSMHPVRFWATNMTNCPNGTESAKLKTTQEYLEKVIELSRLGQDPAEYIDFSNSVRGPESPIEQRYKGAERLEKLMALKQKWDPQAVFGADLC